MKHMKVLLMVVYNDSLNESQEEIGICSITAFLREQGYEVLLMGAGYHSVDYEKIAEFKPDIAGFPVYNLSKQSVYEVGTKIKSLLPGVLVCVGGALPTYHGCEMMEEAPFIDFAMFGEGEFVWLGLLSSLEGGGDLKKVKGLIHRSGNEIITNEPQELIGDIDSLPPMSRDLLSDNKIQIAHMLTSRGCTANCHFCCSPDFWRRNWRGRDTKKVVDEIEHIVNHYGVNRFEFADNSFEDPGMNYERVKDIAEEILKRGLKISYYVDFRAEFHRKATVEILELLKESGLCGVYFGVESGNDADQRVYGKRATVEDNIKGIEVFRDYGFVVTIGFINFNPYTSFENLHKNIDFLGKYDFAGCIANITNTYRLFKGTKLFKRIQDDGLMTDGRYDDFFRFRFVDERVGNLSSFLNGYFSSNKENSLLAAKNYFYSYRYIANLAHYKRLFDTDEHGAAYELVLDNEQQVMDILSELNYRNARWFRQMLELGEGSFDEGKATGILDEAMDRYVKPSVSALDKKGPELWRGLLNLGTQYEKFY